jgi:hypothetical protein
LPFPEKLGICSEIFPFTIKFDLAVDGERQEILNFVLETLRRETGVDEFRIFPVSSAMALASKLTGNEAEYETSGVKVLQEALSDFLTNEKSTVLLVSVLDKALRMANEASHGLRLLKAAGETSQEEAQKKMAALKERFQALRQTARTHCWIFGSGSSPGRRKGFHLISAHF